MESAAGYSPHSTVKPSRSDPFFVVLNVGSGKGDSNVTESTIRGVLTEAGQAHEFLAVHNAEEIPAIARRAVEQAKQRNGVVVAAGGDGTINAIAQAVLGSGRPFGVLPQGTFNYFGRTHGIPEETSQSTRALLDARVHPVQVGMVNGKIFLVNASLGLYPTLLEEREKHKQQLGRSRLVALWSAIVTLLGEHRSLIIEIEHEEGSEAIRTPMLFVGNNALQLEQLGIPEASVVEEGLLTAITTKAVGTAPLLALLIRGAFGKLGEARSVESFAFRRMTVRQRHAYGARRMKVAMDGEVLWMPTPIEFRIAPHPLLLLKPAGGRPKADEA
jgi:diacylglycerol kinase family enzyme